MVAHTQTQTHEHTNIHKPHTHHTHTTHAYTHTHTHTHIHTHTTHTPCIYTPFRFFHFCQFRVVPKRQVFKSHLEVDRRHWHSRNCTWHTWRCRHHLVRLPAQISTKLLPMEETRGQSHQSGETARVSPPWGEAWSRFAKFVVEARLSHS